MSEKLTADQMAQALKEAAWVSKEGLRLDSRFAVLICRALLQRDEEHQRLVAEGIYENHRILALTGLPRDGYTLQQELRAQHEEQAARIDELLENGARG